MKIKRTPIRIANPQPGGATYTSLKRAQDYIDRGAAVLDDDGALFFLSRQTRERERERRQKRLVSSVYSWAGRDSGGSQTVRAGAKHTSGGYRVMQAERGKAESKKPKGRDDQAETSGALRMIRRRGPDHAMGA